MTALLPISIIASVAAFLVGLLNGFPLLPAGSAGAVDSSSADTAVGALSDRIGTSYMAVIDEIISFQTDPDLARAQRRRDEFLGYAGSVRDGFKALELSLRQQRDELDQELARREREAVQAAFQLLMTDAGVASVAANDLSTGGTAVQSWAGLPRDASGDPVTLPDGSTVDLTTYLGTSTTRYAYCWSSSGTVTEQMASVAPCTS